ncbi:hypothetical protein IQ229_21715 [Nostoc cf. edaphicum LEGE 07299]|uniref:Uncharacterized protein n=1 Tax=Nostoc cf. edaphicum LEGE 07299 TaxID=2777974 RepID=A0ABR9U459_9NOSO|nr:hypothetical protein [Nostoc edaphicum]MBE9107451.1 hypothetical protein [Nostoc cf. edaphicum LEGE 07299]
MIALASINISNFLNSSSTSGLPAACDYASMYCNDATDDALAGKEPITEIASSKNLALKNKALLTFGKYAKCGTEEIKTYWNAGRIRDYVRSCYSFNMECARDFSVRGNSNAFWEAVIKWCADR